MKANYIWPAVWGKQFADDDPENLKTVAKYGIVLGTSSGAPMLRSTNEWNIRVDPTIRDSSGNVTHRGIDPWGGNGAWDWTTNSAALTRYWTEGIERMVNMGFDGVVTVGMDGSSEVLNADAIGLEVLKTQRQILVDVMRKPVIEIPQIWMPYKEVMNNWEPSLLAVPDDVTIVWSDDNWGNLRRLQDLGEERAGGYGLYYHFEYVGQGRAYKWVDTNLLPNIWEQLNLAYQYGVDRVWMVNVGDMKNMEVSLQFFLDYAWNPDRWPIEHLREWEEQWAEQQFGSNHARDIAHVLHEYQKLQSDRKPELTNRRIAVDPAVDMDTEPNRAVVFSDEAYFNDANGKALPPEQRIYHDDNPFSLTAYREMETVVADWQALAREATGVEADLLADNPEKHAAYYELVNYAVQASANLYALRLAQFKNLLYAAQGRASTNIMGATAESRFADDQKMSDYYNGALAEGKWAGWQTQPKIGYGDQGKYGARASWQEPQLNFETQTDAIFPALMTLDVSNQQAEMGVSIDGSSSYWTSGATDVLPTFSPYQSQPAQYFEIFNRGSEAFDFQITLPPWLRVTLTPATNTLNDEHQEVHAELALDWDRLPPGISSANIEVTSSAGASVTIPFGIETPALPPGFAGFVESNGYVSIEAEHYSKAVSASPIWWRRLPDIGRTGSGVTPFPVSAPRQDPLHASSGPHLEYSFFLAHAPSNPVKVWAYLSPRNNVRRNAAGVKMFFASGEGLKYAISIDDAQPMVTDINRNSDDVRLNKVWVWHTSDNVTRSETPHTVEKPGVHTLKFWMVDPTVILQKLVIDTGTGELKESYFGPPESCRWLRTECEKSDN